MSTEGDTLRLAIKKAKIKQEEFAEKMGFSRNYLLRLMEGSKDLSDEIKLRAAAILGTSVNELFGVQKQTSAEPAVAYLKTERQATSEELMKLINTQEDLIGVQKRIIDALDRQIADLQVQLANAKRI